MRTASLVLAAVALAAGFAFVSTPASAASTNLSRDQIRSMPITERPSRPGHVYGNTVRFFHHLRTR